MFSVLQEHPPEDRTSTDWNYLGTHVIPSQPSTHAFWTRAARLLADIGHICSESWQPREFLLQGKPLAKDRNQETMINV
jgi:hypothetical protein